MDAEESRVVEETLGANADTENGLCQFITIPITDSLDQKNTFLLLSSQTMTQLQSHWHDQCPELSAPSHVRV